MEIDTQTLTTCEVAADGAVSLGFLDSGGKRATIRLSLNEVGALAMTLPKLIDQALQARFGDASLRYAYPLASWVVEPSSDPVVPPVGSGSVPSPLVFGSAFGATVSERSNVPSVAPVSSTSASDWVVGVVTSTAGVITSKSIVP